MRCTTCVFLQKVQDSSPRIEREEEKRGVDLTIVIPSNIKVEERGTQRSSKLEKGENKLVPVIKSVYGGNRGGKGKGVITWFATARDGKDREK